MCSLWARTARSVQTRSRCWAASGMRQLNLMQAAGGWHSCAEGVPTGQSAASASSVLSSEEHRKDRFLKTIPPVPPFPFPLNTPAASLIYSLHRFILSCHFTETNKCCTKSAHCWTETDAFEILPASSSPLPCLLTKAAEYKLLILKLSQKKFQRSSKAH